MPRNKLNLKDQRFGKLVAIKETNERKGGSIVWLCRCDCGNKTKVSSNSLKFGNVKSCGCLKRGSRKTAYLPSYRINREYESPLHEYRVSKDWTVKDLVKHSNTHANNVCGLANGIMAPVVKGKITKAAQNIAKALDVTIEDLFPRYFCKIVNVDSFQKDQINNMSLSQHTLFESKNNRVIPAKDFWIKIKLYLKPKHFKIIFLRYKLGYTLQEVGDEFGLTREGIRQIEEKCFKKLKFKLIESV